ncbi:NTP transferase domain-containing protein [Pseudomaricurvus sp. HS19]|nr:NTP transferase domain-containing protein [Pseudomaricurvus sp. HS19]
MGSNKALLAWGNVRLVDHLLGLLQSQCRQVLVSTNTVIDALPATVPQLSDTITDAGPLGGVLTGLEWLQQYSTDEWLLSCAVDTPGIPADLLASLIRAWESGSGVVVPVYQQRLHPTCSLWHRSVASQLRRYLEDGERRMLRFLDSTSHSLAAFDDRDGDPFINLNTPEELAGQQSQPHRP